MQDANESQAQLYISAVKSRNRSMLIEIICRMYPDVLWGAVTRELSQEDKEWAKEALKGVF